MLSSLPEPSNASLGSQPGQQNTLESNAGHTACGPSAKAPLTFLVDASALDAALHQLDLSHSRKSAAPSSPDNHSLAPSLQSPFSASNQTSDSDTSHHTPSSSAESIGLVSTDSPWPRRETVSAKLQAAQLCLDTAMDLPLGRPNSVICSTDGEDDMPTRFVWTPSPTDSRRSRNTFWTGTAEPRRVTSAAASPRNDMRQGGVCYARDDSPCLRSSADERASSDHSCQSGVSGPGRRPAIRVTESPQGPRLSFITTGIALLGPPLPILARSGSPSSQASSTATTTARPPSSRSTQSSSEPSTVSRKSRFNRLRGLVSNLDFTQPWSLVERPNNTEGEDDESDAEETLYWPAEEISPPQINRLSLGRTFQADDIAPLANSSSVSLPASPAFPDRCLDTWPRARTYCRSLVNVSHNRGSAQPAPPQPDQTECPTPPPNHWPKLAPQNGLFKKRSKRTMALDFAMPSHSTTTPENSSQSMVPARVNTQLRKSKSMRPMRVPREPPRPPRLRKESFGVAHTGYSKSLRPVTPVMDSAGSWRESSNAYQRIISTENGAMEVKRQEVMWEMCETESAFVRSCRDVLRLFVAPLRTPHGQWIPGIPDGVTYLFEALETITQVHAKLTEELNAIRGSADLVHVGSFASVLLHWIPGLACHEQYLLLFDKVVQTVEEAAHDDSSTFGEFLRLQMSDEALGSLSLGSMLLKPVQRLTKYPLFLKRLSKATPSSHAAHGTVLAVIDVTESLLLTLQDRKALEDDLQQLSLLEDHLDNLPHNLNLTGRCRRLVAHAQVVRVIRDSNDGRSTFSRATSLRSLRASLSSASSSFTAPRSRPIPSSYRVHSPDLGKHMSPGPTTVPSSAASSAHSSGASSPVREERTISRSPSCSSLAEGPLPVTRLSSKVRHEDELTLLVFDTMVVLAAATPDSKRFFKARKAEPVRFRVLSATEGGWGQVEDVREVPGIGPYPNVFELALRPPDGQPVTTTYAMAAPTSQSRRTQRTGLLSGQALETVTHVVNAVASARPTVDDVQSVSSS